MLLGEIHVNNKLIAIAIVASSTLTIGSMTSLFASNYPEHSKNIKDWRTTGTPEEQLKALVKVTPGTHHWMPEIAYRFQSIYWSAKQEKWDFANYQIRSLEKTIKRVALARTKRGPSIDTFREIVFPALYSAAESKNWATFNKAIITTSTQCMACHAKEGFPYITVPFVPPKPNSVVLGYPE